MLCLNQERRRFQHALVAQRSRAFTLIELIVTIGVIAVVLSISLPALQTVIRRARMTMSLSNTRSLSQIVLADPRVEREWPVFEPGKRYSPPFNPHSLVWWGRPDSYNSYWAAPVVWPDIFEYTKEDFGSVDVLVSPGFNTNDLPPYSVVSGHYVMTASAFGDPRLWDEQGSTEAAAVPAMRRGIRLSEVAFPSQKALLWDRKLGWMRPGNVRYLGGDLDVKTPVAAFDGSSKLRVPADATAPVVCLDPVRLPKLDTPLRLHDTPGGVRGRDW